MDELISFSLKLMSERKLSYLRSSSLNLILRSDSKNESFFAVRNSLARITQTKQDITFYSSSALIMNSFK